MLGTFMGMPPPALRGKDTLSYRFMEEEVEV